MGEKKGLSSLPHPSGGDGFKVQHGSYEGLNSISLNSPGGEELKHNTTITTSGK